MAHEYVDELDALEDQHELGGLETLEIAFSPIEEQHIDDIAIFLSKVIPPECEFFTEDYLDIDVSNRRGVPIETLLEIRSRREKWKKVETRLKLLHRARSSDRKRLLEMERKIVVLEDRSQLAKRN